MSGEFHRIQGCYIDSAGFRGPGDHWLVRQTDRGPVALDDIGHEQPIRARRDGDDVQIAADYLSHAGGWFIPDNPACVTADGWSLHAANATDAEIADGSAPPIICGAWAHA
jgi:hypothetical protein